VFNHQRKDKSQRKPSRAEGAIAKLDARLGRIVALMQASIGIPQSLHSIYKLSCVEASTARRLFHRTLNISPNQYYRQLRVEYGKEMLLNSALSVTQIAESCGYADASSFTRAYSAVYGITPGKDKLQNNQRI
jgi:transcriptional regulator GlxA family with amidase domain